MLRTMKAALVTAFGTANPAVTMSTDYPVPAFSGKQQQVLVRTLTCSTAASDVHLLSNRLSFVFRPPSMPYIPGKDVCGVVEAVSDSSTSSFKPGDVVVGGRDAAGEGGMAEYVLLEEFRTCLKPAGVDPATAACCPDSSVTALNALEAAKVRPGERVLILGGSGGVGSALVQLAVNAGAGFIAATSTQQQLVSSLGAHTVIDYTKENWWEVPDFQKQPFDVLFDCVGGGGHFNKAKRVLKSSWGGGGRFVAVVGDDPRPLVQTWYQLLGFAARMLWRPLLLPLCPWLPRYLVLISSTSAGQLGKILDLVAAGRIKVVLDPVSPLPFTAEGVKKALAVQSSWHAHGKVVVQVAEQ